MVTFSEQQKIVNQQATENETFIKHAYTIWQLAKKTDKRDERNTDLYWRRKEQLVPYLLIKKKLSIQKSEKEAR